MLARNEFGRKFFNSLSEHYIPSKAFKSVRKLIIKDPVPQKLYRNEAN